MTLADGATTSRLEADGLQKTYGSRKVVKDVHLAVRAGEVVGLLGPNGAGKTTSFYMIVGLVRADAGQITLAGQRVDAGERLVQQHERRFAGQGPGDFHPPPLTARQRSGR